MTDPSPLASFPVTWSVVALSLLAAIPACSGGNAASVLATPPEYAPRDQSRCGVVRSQASPLIVEWPAAARAQVESLSKRGLVVVRYEGCEMKVLPQCQAAGAYQYTPTTRQRDKVSVRDADDLYAKLPIGAAGLEAKLKKAGELSVAMTIVGTFQADTPSVRRDELSGDCDEATHLVTALSAGAFQLAAGADAEVHGGASYGPIEGGARSTSERETLNEAGDETACAQATAGDAAPPYGCGALVRLEVVPIGRARAAAVPVIEARPTEKPSVEPPGIAPEPPAEKPDAGALPPLERHTRTEEPPRCPDGALRIGSSCEPEGPSVPDSPPPKPASSSTPWIIGTVVVLGAALGVVAIVVAATREDPKAAELPQHGLGSGTVGFRPWVTW